MKKREKFNFKQYMKGLWHEMKVHKTSYLFIAPYCILFFIFTVLPVFISIALSFTSFNILEPPKFVGFGNYLRLFFTDSIFTEKAIGNTFVIAMIVGPVGYILCLLLAWMLNELPRAMRTGIF